MRTVLEALRPEGEMTKKCIAHYLVVVFLVGFFS